MKKLFVTPLPILILTMVLLLCTNAYAATELSFDLFSAIQFAMKNNPSLRNIKSSIDTEKYNIDAARSERLPRIDFTTGATRYKYPTALTPVVIEPPLSSLISNLPEFEQTIYDGAASLRITLFRGGRIMRNIHIAEIRKSLAEDTFAQAVQDLVYNVTSVYYKILQLKKLLASQEASVEQLETHRSKADQFYQAGTVARLDVLRADTELARGKDSFLVTKNSLESTVELFKNFLGLDDLNAKVALIEIPSSASALPSEDAAISAALSCRMDYKALAKKMIIAEERIRAASGKRLGDLSGAGEYSNRAGNSLNFQENWYMGLRYTLPVFDGGLIKSEVKKERVELSKLKEEERAQRLAISREVKDARLSVVAASERITVTQKAVSSAHEAARIERLKYETGAGTSTDVLDAQTALTRAETDSYQAVYDKMVGLALLKKTMGDFPAGIADQETKRPETIHDK